MGIQFSSQTTSKTRHNWSRQDLGQHLDFYRIGSYNIYETHFHKSNSLRTAAFFLSCIFFGEFFSYETMMKFMNGTFLRGVWSTIFMGISRWNIYPIILWVASEEQRCKFCRSAYIYANTHTIYTYTAFEFSCISWHHHHLDHRHDPPHSCQGLLCHYLHQAKHQFFLEVNVDQFLF